MPIVGLLFDRDHPDRRLDVAKLALVIGRSQESDLVVDHSTVSRQHATIKLEEGAFRIFDLGSSNGTFVNDQRVTDPVVLQDGDVVRFSDVAFVFKIISLVAKRPGANEYSFITVGRATNNDIVLELNSVSKCHAVLSHVGDDYSIADAGSSNGTKLNGRPLLPNRPNKSSTGDTVSLSENVTGLFVDAATAQVWYRNFGT